MENRETEGLTALGERQNTKVIILRKSWRHL